MLFQIISILVFGALGAVLHRDAKRRFGSNKSVRRVIWTAVRGAFTGPPAAQGSWVPRTRAAARKGAHLSALVLAGILAATGFLQVVITGSSPSGVLLLVHMIAAPLFALTLAAVSLLWSHEQQVREADLPVLGRAVRAWSLEGPDGMAAIARVLYWAVLVLSLPLILSIILSLFPLFGTAGENCLIGLHGYSALALVTVTILHGYICILQSQTGTQQG
jgi:hypothetical protein